MIAPTRKAVAMTPINTGIFQGLIVQGPGDINSFRVEVDLGTSNFYTDKTSAGGFFPPPGDTPSQFKSSMGLMLVVLFVSGAVNMELRVNQAFPTNTAFNVWQEIYRIHCSRRPVPIRIPLVSSIAKVDVINNSGGAPTNSLLSIKVIY